MMSKVMATLVGMVVGAGLFATGLATGVALERQHQVECDDDSQTMGLAHPVRASQAQREHPML